MNIPIFWYESCSFGPLSENPTLYSDKVEIWSIKGHFFAKIDSFERFLPITSKRRYESS